MKLESFRWTSRPSFSVFFKRRSSVPSAPHKFENRISESSPRQTVISLIEVEKGRFRRDLYFRLNVITLRLPPLRNRTDDIPDLVEHFLRRYGRGHVMSGEAMEALVSYEWPGNVRQLEHCIQHMVAVNSGPVLHSARSADHASQSPATAA